MYFTYISRYLEDQHISNLDLVDYPDVFVIFLDLTREYRDSTLK
jgi:hypothetical protein